MLYWLSKLPGYEKCFKMYKCKNLQWRKVYQFTYEDNNFKMRRIYTHKQYNEVVADTDILLQVVIKYGIRIVGDLTL